MAAPTWTVGQVLTSSDVNTWFVPLAACKTADQNLASNTTLQNDNTLFLPAAVNAIYWFECVLHYKGTTAGSGDLRVNWSVPSGATLRASGIYLSTGLTAQIGVEVVSGTTFTCGTNGTGNPLSLTMEGSVIMDGTAGNVQLQWAQNTSSGTATTVMAGSALVLSRIG